MASGVSSRQRVEFGDWQTPLKLARELVIVLADSGVEPACVLEPTCGKGSFLLAAHERWPAASLVGLEVNQAYVAEARLALGDSALVKRADFFTTSWEFELDGLPDPLLVIGNPPWVTASKLGLLESGNLPEKANFKNFSGLDAITGKANFDVSEWMTLRLLNALRCRPFVLCFLCKAIVARRVMEHSAKRGWGLSGSLHRIDSSKHFGASVEAVALTLSSEQHTPKGRVVRWPFYPALSSLEPSHHLGVVDGTSSADVDAYLRTRHLAGACQPPWRSGLKHDCAAVMELVREASTVSSRASGMVELEETYLYPLLKGSDVANNRWPPTRAVLVPQRVLGEDTAQLRTRAPKTWSYLESHQSALAARKSSIYKGQPRFAVFGVGDYTFAPFKIAIAGLYKRLSFMFVPPHEGRPVVFDDTTYFLAFDDEEQARYVHRALNTEIVRQFFEARVFWEDKRPINKQVLQALDLQKIRSAAVNMTAQ